MAIDHRGAWVGTPTELGEFSVAVEVTDGCFRRMTTKTLRVSPAPILSVNAEKLEFRIIQGAPPFDAGLIQVSGAPEETAYQLDVLDAPWLKAGIREGALPKAGRAFVSDSVRVTIDAEKLPAGTHHATLRFSAWRGANAPELRYTVHVAPAVSAFPKVEWKPLLIPERHTIVEVPGVADITPPVVHRPPPPVFPKYIPKPKPKPSSPSNWIRSRVLPIPKVVLPPPAPAKPAAPERTKPSAMPPPPEPAKPKAAH
ncbi:MAG: hypothetical protein FJW30_13980 [Acidobacteria bacterium]|nr:hypothetical protein [Acidobacteriota bacterium]